MSGALVPTPQSNVDTYRASTDAAGLCREIVVATASNIQGRKFVSVEGWQAIAIAHGCAAGSRDVEKIEGGVRAIGEIRRMVDGQVIATAEGFVGEDEPTWFGGVSRGKALPKRADYAIRAMAQTRAISRAARSAFAHVVVMMNANLSTTPAEEVPDGGFEDQPADRSTPSGRQKPAPLTGKHKTRDAARQAYGEIVRELNACEDDDQLEAFLDTIREDAIQFRSELPLFWNGDGADFEGLKREVEKARVRCAEPATYQPTPLDAG